MHPFCLLCGEESELLNRFLSHMAQGYMLPAGRRRDTEGERALLLLMGCLPGFSRSLQWLTAAVREHLGSLHHRPIRPGHFLNGVPPGDPPPNNAFRDTLGGVGFHCVPPAWHPALLCQLVNHSHVLPTSLNLSPVAWTWV